MISLNSSHYSRSNYCEKRKSLLATLVFELLRSAVECSDGSAEGSLHQIPIQLLVAIVLLLCSPLGDRCFVRRRVVDFLGSNGDFLGNGQLLHDLSLVSGSHYSRSNFCEKLYPLLADIALVSVPVGSCYQDLANGVDHDVADRERTDLPHRTVDGLADDFSSLLEI